MATTSNASRITRLNGWHRLGIIFSAIWGVCVFAELLTELHEGPFSLGLLTDTLVTKTGEPISNVDPMFRDLVPVDQYMNTPRLAAYLLVPIAVLWVAGFAFAWVKRGFNV
jgi:hypothetical protein